MELPSSNSTKVIVTESFLHDYTNTLNALNSNPYTLDITTKFRVEINKAMDRIIEFQEIGLPTRGLSELGIKHIQVRKFNRTIYYQYAKDTVTFVRLLHVKQVPQI